MPTEAQEEEKCGLGSQAQWGADLGLFSSGLFGFYQFAQFEVKDQFLEIIEKYYLKLEKELHISLSGFFVCMLPALEDQNAALIKKVESIFDLTEQIVGSRIFFGTIWMVRSSLASPVQTILRTPRSRLAAIKLLDKRIPRSAALIKRNALHPVNRLVRIERARLSVVSSYETEEREDEILRIEKEQMDSEDYFYFFYPKKSKLVVNALLACLEDSSVYVNRGALDFLISHMPITMEINKKAENVALVYGSLQLIYNKDFACLKKFSTWLLGHLDEDEKLLSLEEDRTLQALIPALKSIFQLRKDMTEKEASKPLVIMQTLLNENQGIAEPIIRELTINIVRFIHGFYTRIEEGASADKQFGKKFRTEVDNFFEQIFDQQRDVWLALGALLSQEMNEVKILHQEQAITLVEFCLNQLPITKIEDLVKFMRPILSRLLSGVDKLCKNMQEPKNAIPAINLALKLMEKLKEEDQKDDDISFLVESVQNFNHFYSALCDAVVEEDAEESAGILGDEKLAGVQHNHFAALSVTFNTASKLIIGIQKYISDVPKGGDRMPEWLSSLLHCCVSKRPQISLVAIETFLPLLRHKFAPGDPYSTLKR